MKALLALAVLGFGCATTTPPIVITGHSITTAGVTFEATASVLDSLYKTGAVTEAQYAPWRDFSARWQATYHAARMTYDDATSKGDVPAQQMAANVLDGLIGELGTYEALIAQVLKPKAPPPPSTPPPVDHSAVVTPGAKP